MRRTWRRITVRQRQALDHRRAGVVGVQCLDRARTRHAGDVAEEHEDEGQRRQQEVLDLGEDAGAVRRLRGGGQQPQPQREDEDEDRRPHELGHRRGREAAHGDQPVGGAALLHGGVDAADDPERDDDDERQDRQLERRLQRGPDDVRDRLARGDRGPEVAGDEAAQPVQVLHDQRAVGAELLVELVDRGLIGEGAEDAPADVAGEHLGGEEDEHAQQQQRDQPVQRAPENEPSDGVAPSAAAGLGGDARPPQVVADRHHVPAPSSAPVPTHRRAL